MIFDNNFSKEIFNNYKINKDLKGDECQLNENFFKNLDVFQYKNINNNNKDIINDNIKDSNEIKNNLNILKNTLNNNNNNNDNNKDKIFINNNINNDNINKNYLNKMEDISTEKTKKYTITTKPSDYICLKDENFQTNEEYIKKFIEIINEPITPSVWEEMHSKHKIFIYNKRCFLPDNKTKSLIIKTMTELPCKFDIVVDIFKDYDFRGNFDPYFKKRPIVIKSDISSEEKDITKSIEYLILKMPMIFSDRDFVNEKIECNNNYLKENSYCYVYHSSTHKNYPEEKKIVRGEFIIQGIYLEKKDENNTLFRMCSQMDMKMPVGGVDTVYKKIPEKQAKFVEDLIKYYPRYKKE